MSKANGTVATADKDADPSRENSGASRFTTTSVLAGSSHHSWCRKFRFASTLTSIFAGVSLVTPAKDYYLEKFGADPLAMGILFFVVSFFTPINEILTGRLQNMEALSWLFPVSSWGRKAPWLTTHTVLLALASGVLYLPPGENNAFILHSWFLVLSVVTMWGVSTMIIAFESARIEIYPYNEERSSVEMASKIGATIGMAAGLAPMLVLLADSSFVIRLGASCFWAVVIVVFGLQAQPIWLEARSTTTEEDHSIFEDMRIAWASAAFRQLVFVRLYDGLYQGLLATNIFYYITYILQITGMERSIWLVLVGIAAVIGEMLMASIVSKLLSHRAFSYKLQNFVIQCRLLGAVVSVVLLVLPVWMYGWKPLLDDDELNISRWIYLAYSFISRVFQSPFTFWRVAAQCWIVDEDIQQGDGARREAAFIAVASATQNFARALGASLTFLGYSMFGLDPGNCDNRCKDSWHVAGFEFEAESENDCKDECAESAIMRQPDHLRMYIRAIFVIGLTVFDLLVVVHTYVFPIQGIRLARLYNKQTVALGGRLKGVTDGTEAAKYKPPSVQHQARHSPGKSKVVLFKVDAQAGISQVEEIKRHGAAGGSGPSCLTGRRKPQAPSISVVFNATPLGAQGNDGAPVAENGSGAAEVPTQQPLPPSSPGGEGVGAPGADGANRQDAVDPSLRVAGANEPDRNITHI